ncbi:hypothetical protein MSP8886_01440 [Marinomonas spartinae]|uniref:Uncharacterized protein n=1 Tax=Marinomonas spartinae TaxID=1792290 RepID=A0A1A8TBW6_9GAMM|nr:hypothetical protein [Marinomonas spartinae]SBS29106.1 hypothetical protein MSP8886_01440 [Marinomonas spartinae]
MVTINSESKIAPTWFKSDRDESGDVEWLLKPLSGLEFMQVQSGASINSEGHFTYSGQAMRDALRFAIQNWKGFFDAEGKPIEYSQHMLNLVKQKYLVEVFNEIINRAFIREYEEKN